MLSIVYHQLQMRRGFSILLMLVFGLMPLSPLIDGSEDTRLPVCCRRHGAHHCSMNVAAREVMDPGGNPALAAPPTCPDYPGDATALCTPPPALTVSTPSVSILVEQASVASVAAAAPASTSGSACSGRGPPTKNLG
jgi:hypothetical protein